MTWVVGPRLRDIARAALDAFARAEARVFDETVPSLEAEVAELRRQRDEAREAVALLRTANQELRSIANQQIQRATQLEYRAAVAETALTNERKRNG